MGHDSLSDLGEGWGGELMAALHDFLCRSCQFVFEAGSIYIDDVGVQPEPCPDCQQPCDIVWLTAPSLKADGNLTAEEKVAGALKMGIFNDGRMSLPQTRTDMRKIRAEYGDIPVGARELLQRPTKRQRTEAERDTDRRETIEMIRKRRAMRRAGEIPRIEIDPEVARAMSRTPVTNEKVLAGKKV